MEHEIISTKCDNNGRIVSLLLKIQGQKINIIGIYCPNDPKLRCEFISCIQNYVIDDNPNTPLFILGDFNFIDDFNTDKMYGSNTWRGCLRGTKEFNALRTLLIYTKPPECVDIIRRTSRGFHSWCPGVLRTRAFRAPAVKTS